MEFNEIINILKKYLPEYLIKNKSFIEILKVFEKCLNEEILIEITNQIYDSEDELKEINNIIPLQTSSNILLIETSRLFLSIYKKEKYEIIFSITNTVKNDLIETITMEILINEEGANWRITRNLEDSNNYCYGYNTEFYSYNKNNDLVPILGLEQAKDDDFIEMFGVPMTRVRECRLNFEKNIEYINKCRKSLIIKNKLKELEIEMTTFTIPFKITDFARFVVEYVEDDNEYEFDTDDEYLTEEELTEDQEEFFDEEELVSLEEELRRATEIQERIITHTGIDGEFTISVNIYSNIQDYICGIDTNLCAMGYLIQKLSNNYTIFKILITSSFLMIIPYEATKEQIVALYNNNPANKYIYGLPEFFEQDLGHKLEN